MDPAPQPGADAAVRKVNRTLLACTVVFGALAVGFVLHRPSPPDLGPPIPPVDPALIVAGPARQSYADFVRAGEDVTHYSCYMCHERGKSAPLRFDEQFNIIVPDAHDDIVMGHGDHSRNNHCYNCHAEDNLEALYLRDGRKLEIQQSSMLCGSCHGPTYSNWEAGEHGRTTGYWDLSLGSAHRLDCVNCHDPHAPAIPSRKPLPGPNPPRPARHGEPTGSP